MAGSTLIRDIRIVNEGSIREGSVLIENGIISKVMLRSDPGYEAAVRQAGASAEEILENNADALLLPGVIDDQVHFREPGATAKGCIASESAAAVLGGTTSFMDMPNNNPPATTLSSLEEKYSTAARDSPGTLTPTTPFILEPPMTTSRSCAAPTPAASAASRSSWAPPPATC